MVSLTEVLAEAKARAEVQGFKLNYKTDFKAKTLKLFCSAAGAKKKKKVKAGAEPRQVRVRTSLKVGCGMMILLKSDAVLLDGDNKKLADKCVVRKLLPAHTNGCVPCKARRQEAIAKSTSKKIPDAVLQELQTLVQ